MLGSRSEYPKSRHSLFLRLRRALALPTYVLLLLVFGSLAAGMAGDDWPGYAFADSETARGPGSAGGVPLNPGRRMARRLYLITAKLQAWVRAELTRARGPGRRILA